MDKPGDSLKAKLIALGITKNVSEMSIEEIDDVQMLLLNQYLDQFKK